MQKKGIVEIVYSCRNIAPRCRSPVATTLVSNRILFLLLLAAVRFWENLGGFCGKLGHVLNDLDELFQIVAVPFL